CKDPGDDWETLLITNCFGPYDTLLQARERLKKKLENLDAVTTDADAPLAAFQELEQNIITKVEVYNELANKLDWVGGNDVRDCTFNTMSKLMSDEVASVVNWKGRNNKMAFGSMETSSVVTNCVHFFFGKKKGTMVKVQSAIKDWLKAAPTRLKNTTAGRNGTGTGEEINQSDEDSEDEHIESPSSS
ncbi:unnamed protein product, partial [Allacma fusca]